MNEFSVSFILPFQMIPFYDLNDFSRYKTQIQTLLLLISSLITCCTRGTFSTFPQSCSPTGKHAVYVDGFFYDQKFLSRGILQGSVVGPALFATARPQFPLQSSFDDWKLKIEEKYVKCGYLLSYINLVTLTQDPFQYRINFHVNYYLKHWTSWTMSGEYVGGVGVFVIII